MKLVKAGKFAFEGVRVKSVDSLDGLTSKELIELTACGWVVDGVEAVNAPCDDNTTHVESPDFDFASSLDKDDLDEYAASFGVKLDKRKSVEKMFAAFRESFEAE